MSEFAAMVPRPDPSTVNQDLSSAQDTTMIAELGAPSLGLTAEQCRDHLASDTVRALLETRSFGRFEVTGIAPALDSLQGVMDAVRVRNPTLFDAIGTAGMLCVRLRRPTSGVPSTRPSNHAWGTAIDIAIDGAADTVPDGRVQRGILELIPLFNAAGWFWGGGFSAADDTHFEVADETVVDWSGGGRFLVTPPTPPPASEVVATQPVSKAQGRQLLIAAMNAANLTDNTLRRGIAAIAAVESGFVPKSEIGYGHTANDRIRAVFGSRVAGLDEAELSRVKRSDEEFFNLVYGGGFGRKFGNTEPGDGFKYRGRGLFQLTLRSNYERYGGMIGLDLVASPDQANDGATAARIAVVYLLDRLRGSGFAAMKAAVGHSTPDIDQRKDARFAEFTQTREFDAG